MSSAPADFPTRNGSGRRRSFGDLQRNDRPLRQTRAPLMNADTTEVPRSRDYPGPALEARLPLRKKPTHRFGQGGLTEPIGAKPTRKNEMRLARPGTAGIRPDLR